MSRPERAGGDGLDIERARVLAEPHDRALAEAALDLRQRGIKGLRFVHGRSFDETKRGAHVFVLLMVRIRKTGNAAGRTRRRHPRGPSFPNGSKPLYTICSGWQDVLFLYLDPGPGTGPFPNVVVPFELGLVPFELI